MSQMVVLLGLAVLAGAHWSKVVLGDQGRYLRAVSSLATSPTFARLAGVSVSLATRHRLRHQRMLAARAARSAGTVTRWAMNTRVFAPSWTMSHRMLHRHRPSGLRITAIMVGLATMGSIVRAAKWTPTRGPVVAHWPCTR